ncbi:MAG: hypothetical protein JSU63_03185 [Phycisphaerales bacterium]|nr:MAG: hypothetical protein JSU63_03185 [Phycisphaerales bacterium]
MLTGVGVVFCLVLFVLMFLGPPRPAGLTLRVTTSCELGISRESIRFLWTSAGQGTIAWDVVCLSPHWTVRRSLVYFCVPVWLFLPAAGIGTTLIWRRMGRKRDSVARRARPGGQCD